jgi:iron complex outermembrane recepter protein
MFRKTEVSSALAIAFSSALMGVAVPGVAQQSEQKLERVEITGSSIKRIDAETSLPVQILTRQDIQKTGATNVEQLLKTVSAMSSSGGLAASSASGSTTGGISAVSLRGLTSIRTLVLLNGRRIAPYGVGFTGDSVSVDVNSIPLAAVDRVEILKDGASAIYGSDAIAGVVNFILRKDFKGVELAADYGDTTQGGAKFQKVSGTVGFGDLTADRFNVMLVGSYQKEGALFGRDRAFASSGINVGANNDTTSGNTFPGNISIPEAARDPDTGNLIPITRNPAAATGCLLPYSQLDPLYGSRQCRFDPSPLVTLLPESERGSVFGVAKFAINNDLEAFAEASYNKNTQRTVIQPVPISDQFALPSNHPLYGVAPYNGVATFLLRPSSRYYPSQYISDQYVASGLPIPGTLPDVLVRYRAPGNRDFTDISEAPRVAVGLKGLASGWDFDSAILHSQSKVREMVNGGYPLYSRILPLLNSGEVNPFGPSAPDVEAQIQASNFLGEAFRVDSSLTSIAAKASREMLQLPAGALGVALGAEARKENYLFEAASELQIGDVSGYGGNFLRTDKSRKVAAVFGEVNVPIARGLEANAAVRYDKYQGVGNSTTPKVSARWQPTKEFLLRGSLGKGFRAPSLQDLFLPATTGVTPPGLNDPLRCSQTGDSNDCGTQFTVANGGTSTLKPERSKSKTIGFVLEPSAYVSVSMDWFNIVLKDAISNGIPAAVILADLDKYGYLVTRGPVDPGRPNLPGPIVSIDQTNLNFGSTKVSGLDWDFKLRVPEESFGRFTLGIAGSYFIQFDTENPDGTFTGQVDQVNSSTGGVTPRWKHRLALDWVNGNWAATVAQNFQKGYHDLPGTFEDPSKPGYAVRRVGSYETIDVQGTYVGFKNLRFSLGVKNLFDREPPYTNAGGQTSFQAGYDPQYGDARGRFVYGRVAYLFN